MTRAAPLAAFRELIVSQVQMTENYILSPVVFPLICSFPNATVLILRGSYLSRKPAFDENSNPNLKSTAAVLMGIW